jgi:crotonobetainyl-CoA:carnitine CoA-transferase CaiB-like acyl-CoA transferase
MSGLTYAENETDVRKTFSSIDLIYETKDGYLTISVISDKEWKGICEALERQELITDERFKSSLARRCNAEERREVIGEEVSKRSSAELLQILDANDVPCAPLLDRAELMDHPQIVESETILRESFTGFGEVRQARPAARFQLTESSLRLPAPKLGQHSREILESLGYDEAKCDALIAANVILQGS